MANIIKQKNPIKMSSKSSTTIPIWNMTSDVTLNISCAWYISYKFQLLISLRHADWDCITTWTRIVITSSGENISQTPRDARTNICACWSIFTLVVYGSVMTQAFSSGSPWLPRPLVASSTAFTRNSLSLSQKCPPESSTEFACASYSNASSSTVKATRK